MFFAGIIILLWALFAFGAVLDNDHWLWLVGFAYIGGFLDARIFRKLDFDKDHAMPPGMEDTPDDGSGNDAKKKNHDTGQ